MVAKDPRKILQLKPLLSKANQFSEKCGSQEHNPKFLNMYCMTCNIEPLCIMCSGSKIESAHRELGHKVVQVQKSTYQNALKAKDVTDCIDGSDIVQCINNHKAVFIIGTRGDPKKHRLFVTEQDCVHCGFALKPTNPQPNAKYCSIECKVKHIENLPAYESTRTDTENLPPPLDLSATTSSQPDNLSLPGLNATTANQPDNLSMSIAPTATSLKCRARMRKGIPRRAPFF
ncbi:uncharacterized protein A4U43_C04F9450 [Asparagus officinalis]|uniref:Uncharacterized protein n=1 Tax=Asparagus officinalis TaxID=4686 RepID=A0A5P1EZJ0_ASPOF|nr:uncharacterized protein LOC109839791 [Asparagus officinalis]ONK71516.1 uncharacterized protein A4U43_C04F9450 [Asparagus officinalis]